MNPELDALWREFEAETDDNIDALERLLTGAGNDWSEDEIGALFRAFHSLKGAFGVMGMPNVEALAHHAEDILAIVRAGRAPLDAELRGLLLFAVDRLKDMRDAVVAHRADAPAAGQAIGVLARYRDALEPHADHGRERTEQAGAPAAAPQAAAAGLGTDAEMIGIYSELLVERAPLIAGILAPAAHDRVAAAQVAAELATGAEVLGFDGLAEQLNALAAPALDRDAPATGIGWIGTGTGQDSIENLSALRGQLELIEELTGLAAGAQPLAAALAASIGPDYREALRALAASLAKVATATPGERGSDAAAGDGSDAGNAADAASALARARALANCADLAGAGRLLIVLEEQLGVIGADQPIESAPLRDGAVEIVATLARAAEAGADVAADAVEANQARWQALLSASQAAVATGAGSNDAIALRPEFLAILVPDQIARIEQALRDGKHAFEVLIDLEADPETAVGIVSWLGSAVATVTSRTVPGSTGNRFEFLILADATIDWVRAQLSDLDPHGACVVAVQATAGHGMPPTAAPRSASEPPAAAFMRVRSDVVDSLMAEVGEMRSVIAALAELVRNGAAVRALPALRRIAASAASSPAASATATPASSQAAQSGAALLLHAEAIEGDWRTLVAFEEQLQASHRRIWEAGLKLRVVPVAALFARLTRAARDLAQRLDKQVDVVVDGRDVRIDRSIVDLLADPLLHMVRNALDHGIEPVDRRIAAGKPARARLALSAVERGSRVQITIADDGRGLDRARIVARATQLGLMPVPADDAQPMADSAIDRLILRPGFSTAETVTELSGRGVGLDVVDSVLQRLGGTIDVQTTPGAGTRFVLGIPIAASLVRSLLVEADGEIYALPQRQIAAVAEIRAAEIESAGAQHVYSYKGGPVALHTLGRLLGVTDAEHWEHWDRWTLRDNPDNADHADDADHADAGHLAPSLQAVIVTTGSGLLGLAVDRIVRFQDLFLKDLPAALATVPAIGGASVLGNGRPVLVLDADGLARWADSAPQDLAPSLARPR